MEIVLLIHLSTGLYPAALPAETAICQQQLVSVASKLSQ